MKRFLSILFCVMAVLGAAAQDRLYIEDFTIAPGESKTVEILLDNAVAYTALQADIYLPDGLSIEQEDGEYIFELTDRKARNHTISSSLLQSGAVRILIASQTVKTFSGNSGALVTFNVIASEVFEGQQATLALRNITATEPDRTEHLLPDSECTVTAESLEPPHDEDLLHIDDFTIVPGETKNVAIQLDNAVAYTALQADLYLPEGLTIEQEDGDYLFDLTSRKGRDHTISSSLLQSGAVRILIASQTVKTFSGNSGALVTFNVIAEASFSGEKTIELRNVTATEPDRTEHLLPDATCIVTSDIQNITATAISLDQTTLTLNLGETETLTATVLPENATNKAVMWATSNTAVATVNQNGTVTAVAVGTATITASTTDSSNLSAICAVTVNPVLVTSVTVSPGSTTLQVGDTKQLLATVAPSNATNKAVTWTSSNTAVAAVSSTGLVTAVAAGTATITATAADGSNLTASCTVTVESGTTPPQPSEGVTLNTHMARLQLGRTLQLENTIGADVVWVSSNNNVAFVANGVVTALSNGMAAITAIDAAGNTDWCAVFCYLPGDINEDNVVDVSDVNQDIILVLDPQVMPELPTDPKTHTLNGVEFTMITVPGGTFTMGATAEQGDTDPWSDERPTHEVTLGSFAIGQTEVTQALWQTVMGSNPSTNVDASKPVENVSWNDCQEFITRLNALTGKQFRLPTEAEWEYAARGGSKSRGYKYAGGDNIDEVAWYITNCGNTSHAVAQKATNELGIYDMSGNVSEWCADQSDAYSSSPVVNPMGSNGPNRQWRGGNWRTTARYCRVSNRNGSAPTTTNDYIGLRLAVDAHNNSSTEAYVDLGLPSGTLWATCNVGARTPEEVGGYFAWGETSPKTHFAIDNYEHYADGSWTDIGTNIAGTQYDAATANWGSAWCMPTANQLSELASNCSRSSHTLNGVSGILFTGPNGKTIFIPNGGHDYEQGDGPSEPNGCGLWTSSAAGSKWAYRAWEWSSIGFSNRYQGFPIRPVRAKM